MKNTYYKIERQNMNWTEIITILIAIYGAILSTFNRITQWRNNMFRLNVKIKWVMPEPLGDLREPTVFLVASNPGKRIITLSSCGFFAPDNKKLPFIFRESTLNFPYELESGKSCKEIFTAREIATELDMAGYNGEIELVGFYSDGLDRKYKSKLWKFNIDDWEKIYE